MHSFPKSRRLLTKRDFQLTFKHAKKVQNAFYRLYWAKRSTGSSRVGLTVAKKNVAKAVKRNLIKRIIRESFRYNQNRLPAVDIIVMVKANANDHDKATLRREIDRLWKKLRVHVEERSA